MTAATLQENKMGVMPVGKLIANMALPMVISMLVQALYNVVDSIYVSQVSESAVTALSLAFPIQNLLIGFAVGIGVGVNSLLSKSLGEKNQEAANRAAGNGIVLMAIAMVLFVLFGLFGVRPYFAIQSDNPETVEGGIVYTSICCVFSVGCFASILGERLLQSTGRTVHTMITQSIGAIINIILDPILIHGWFGLPAMGIAGAAIATVASQVVSAVLCIIKLTRSDGPYRLEIKRIGFDLPLLKKITSQGVPSGVQNSIIAIANVVVQSNINTFGSDAMAGCGSYSKVEGFVFLPITAFAMALTTFIGQNLGAGQFDRAKQGARIGILCSMAMAELIGVALFFLAPYAMRLFNDDPAVVAIGVRQSHIEALFFCFLAFAHGVSAVLRGAGRAQVPMYTMLGCWCILRVSYITLALKVWPDIATIFWAYPITWSVSCVVFLIYYLKADWVHALEKSL